MKSLKIAVAAFAVAATVAACNKTEPTPEVEPLGSFEIEFDYIWAMAGAPFAMNTPLAHPMTGDTLTYTTFMHYVGNVRLTDVDGNTHTDAEAYALFDASDPSSLTLRVTDVPEGDYATLQLTLGVDSAHNVSGAQAGALDPLFGMFWSWNSGYIMIKAEGTSPQSETGSFAYHLGGFSGEDRACTEREFDLASEGLLVVRENTAPVVHFIANPAKLFHTYGSVSGGPTIHMPMADAGVMAQDFHAAVYLDHIHP